MNIIRPTDREEREAKNLAMNVIEAAADGDKDSIFMVKLAENHNCPLWGVVGALGELIPEYGDTIPAREADRTFQKWGCELVLDRELSWLRERGINEI